MLTGLYFLCALAGVFVVVIWEIANEPVGWAEETHGLLRLRDENPPSGDEQPGDEQP